VPSPTTDRKPILWWFSLSRLRQAFARAIPDYADQAEIRVIDKGFEEALVTAQELMQAGEVDVFVAAGANGAYLREHASVPVALISVSGYDVLDALSRARERSERVAIVTFASVTAELTRFLERFGLGIVQRSYTTAEDAAECVQALAEEGIEVVVGPGLVTDLAEQAGLGGVFLYSQRSVRAAIEQAIEMARIARIEEAKRQRINTILQHLDEAVVAVDMEERVQSVNPAMERLLGVDASHAVGEQLSRLAPVLGLRRVLQSGTAELEQILTLGGAMLVTNRMPIREQGVQTGAVLTCRDASAIHRVERSLRARHLPRRFVAKHELGDLVGESAAVRQVRALAARYARTDATVLVTGASGTGKELVAQGIHSASARRGQPFVAINCAAFPETLLESELFGYEEGAFTGSRRGGRAGLFEAAHTGTIFLDEVGEVPIALQTRLLRVLQEREVLRLGSNDPTPVDVRVIAATNRDLKHAIAEGAFREDLFYRLNILHIHLPPLRERPDDIRLLAAHLLGEALRRYGAWRWRERALTALAAHLEGYAWPGNVREMENIVERVAVLYADPDTAGAVDEAMLRVVVPELFDAQPAGPTQSHGPAVALRAMQRETERAHIRRVVEACGGNQAEAARRLGIGRTTLWRKLNARRSSSM
jgi:transcriptional regulator, propionate catabolism operon regulatory protein